MSSACQIQGHFLPSGQFRLYCIGTGEYVDDFVNGSEGIDIDFEELLKAFDSSWFSNAYSTRVIGVEAIWNAFTNRERRKRETLRSQQHTARQG